MELKASAGEIELSLFTGGFPYWVDVKVSGKVVARVHHDTLHDLEYAARRLREKLKQQSDLVS